jgi:signal transduction histidine kinase
VTTVHLADALNAVAVTPDPDDVAVTVDAGAAPVHGDPALLLHTARNLLDNACRHNVPNGWVRARSWTDDDHAVLEVINTGPAIPADAVEALFEPFRRHAADRTAADTGTGLGLSIVRAVARAHRGDATATARPGGGLQVEVRLPSATVDGLRPGAARLATHDR